MLAKLTPNKQLTLPEAALSSCKGAEFFDVSAEGGRIVLTPVRETGADAVRSKLARLGITEGDLTDAVKWARRQ